MQKILLECENFVLIQDFFSIEINPSYVAQHVIGVIILLRFHLCSVSTLLHAFDSIYAGNSLSRLDKHIILLLTTLRAVRIYLHSHLAKKPSSSRRR